ncbi:Pentatricopeptide repeat-containing protein [Dichanthelium oligosanthes]|uniref:Pentatricopeptide repeat-containing protein n=1 Tax=Dichanthelium oligosanthes TaxID=888268 RepID=A0A1E5UV45_9POAL|nr:Pentatricopeptide repeat-containing protein [Dichanthelium oligosanthes]
MRAPPAAAGGGGFNSPWTLAIRAAADQGRPRRAVALYLSSLRASLRPCPFALAAVLKSVPRLPPHAALPAAASLHAHLLRVGLVSHPYPHAALAHAYSRLLPPAHYRHLLDYAPALRRHSHLVSSNSLLASRLRAGDIPAARALFDAMPARDVVSWNSMVAGLARAGHLDEAIGLFDQMPERNAASWNALVCGFIAQGQLAQARELFERMPIRNNVSWITMISGYAKAGDVQAAADLFERMESKDLYAWNAMIACYAQNGCAREALGVFNQMLKPRVWVLPNEKTFSSVISACSQLGDLRFGLWVESFMGSVGVELDDHLRTALVDLYTKSGRMDRAFNLFRGLRTRDLVSYSAMIVGCGMHGKLSEAVGLFKEMSDERIAPNEVTFVGLLSAYSHAGLMEEAHACFSSMSSKYRINPSVEHYTIMVDLLGRSGKLDKAFQLIMQMPLRPHASVWGALLLACRLHNNVELGEVVASKCFELEPEESGYYILLVDVSCCPQGCPWENYGYCEGLLVDMQKTAMSSVRLFTFSNSEIMEEFSNFTLSVATV